MSTRYTYQHLVQLVDGDAELITRLVDEGFIQSAGDDRALVDIDHVLVARTLWRDLDVEWPGIEIVLRLCDDLARARRRITELERELGQRTADSL